MLEKLPEEWVVACPACDAPAGRSCGFVEGARHNGWVHMARCHAFDDAVRENDGDEWFHDSDMGAR